MHWIAIVAFLLLSVWLLSRGGVKAALGVALFICCLLSTVSLSIESAGGQYTQRLCIEVC